MGYDETKEWNPHKKILEWSHPTLNNYKASPSSPPFVGPTFPSSYLFFYYGRHDMPVGYGNTHLQHKKQNNLKKIFLFWRPHQASFLNQTLPCLSNVIHV